MADTNNIKLGTCQITYDSVDLGLTIGGVELSVETNTHETKVDQFGDTTVAEIITGRNVTVSCPMAETTLENLVKIMPGSTLTVDGVDANIKRVDIESGVGVSLRALAKELRLHPIANAEGDETEDVVIPLAATAGAMSFAYKLDQERVYNCEFKGYPDPATKILLYFGDQNAAP